MLCACGDVPTTETPASPTQSNQPLNSGRIENPTHQSNGCTPTTIIVNGELIDLPAACNKMVKVNKGDPWDKGSPVEKFLIKQQEQ
jgi:hypothetical protein